MWNQFKLRNVEKSRPGLVSSARLNAPLFMMLHSSLPDLTCSGWDPQVGPAAPPWATCDRRRGGKNALAADDGSIFMRLRAGEGGMGASVQSLGWGWGGGGFVRKE